MSQRWRMFCWKLGHDILPTKKNLMKRKITQSNTCVICREDESASHLFLYCEVSRRIWSCSSLGIKVSESPRIEVSKWFKNLFIYLTDERRSSNTTWALLAAVNPYGIINVANTELDRWQSGFGSKGQEDRLQKVGKGEVRVQLNGNMEPLNIVKATFKSTEPGNTMKKQGSERPVDGSLIKEVILHGQGQGKSLLSHHFKRKPKVFKLEPQ
ncbi:hypothetical protein RDABS01_002095 [Bienertia sinuspersici]